MASRYLVEAAVIALLLAAQLNLQARDQSTATASPPNSAAQGRSASKSSSQSQNADNQAGESGLQRRDARYRLQISDVIQLDFPLTPEFAQTVTVQPDGFITLRNVGDVKVVGQTLPELTQTLRRAYRKVLHDPIINVDLKDFQRPYFIASGFVARPGKYDLREDTTVTEALAIAGGLSPGAKHSQILLFHKVSDNWAAVKKLDVKHMLREGNLSEDVHLQPGDMLYVPQNAISKIRPFVPLPSVGIYGPRF